MESPTFESPLGESTKPCGYPSCKNTIPKDNSFELCEVCRKIAIRNTMALILDHTTPNLPETYNTIFDRMIHNMRPDEILNVVSKMEQGYLDFLKVVKLNQWELKQKGLLTAQTKRRSEYLQIEAQDAYEKSKEFAPKTHKKAIKKAESRKEKLTKLFHGNEDEAKAFMGMDLSDL